MRSPFCTFLFLLILGSTSQSQIIVGGREYSRAANELGKKGEWVLYPKGAPQEEGYRQWLTKRVLVETVAGTALANVVGVEKTEARGNYTLVTMAGGPEAALHGAARLRKLAGVKSAEPLLARQQYRRFVPNDPLFFHDLPNPGYQWHLRDTDLILWPPRDRHCHRDDHDLSGLKRHRHPEKVLPCRRALSAA